MSNMYNFITKTWNPLAGDCIHNCSYCFVKKMKSRFPVMNKKYSGEPRLIEKELQKKFKPEDVVFVCDCTDLFADNVKIELIERILDYCKNFESTFYFQTKNPMKFDSSRLIFPKNHKKIVTIESDIFYSKIMNNSKEPYKRASQTIILLEEVHQITIEPIMDFSPLFAELIKDCKPEQVNIGADSGRNNLPEPSKEKLLKLISELKKFTIVNLKSNLNRLLQ